LSTFISSRWRVSRTRTIASSFLFSMSVQHRTGERGSGACLHARRPPTFSVRLLCNNTRGLDARIVNLECCECILLIIAYVRTSHISAVVRRTWSSYVTAQQCGRGRYAMCELSSGHGVPSAACLACLNGNARSRSAGEHLCTIYRNVLCVRMSAGETIRIQFYTWPTNALECKPCTKCECEASGLGV
jgi:hypothetical protein